MCKKIVMYLSLCMMFAMMAVPVVAQIEIHVYQPLINTPGAEFGSDKVIFDKVQNYFLEKTGVKFIPHNLDPGRYSEALNMAIAGGEQMDFFYASGFDRNGYVKAKLYTPITQEMLDTYGPTSKGSGKVPGK